MEKELKKENIIRCISFLDLGYKFLYLTENSLNELVKSGNCHMILTDNPLSDQDYFKITRWSDFNVIIPVLFNFFHGLELIMKGILFIHKEIKSNHNIFESLKKIKEEKKYPEEIILILEKYINKEKIHPFFKLFLESNDINVIDLYEFLRYPYNKNFEKSINYFNLKYKEKKAIPFFKEIIKDSENLRLEVGKYYSKYREIILT